MSNVVHMFGWKSLKESDRKAQQIIDHMKEINDAWKMDNEAREMRGIKPTQRGMIKIIKGSFSDD